MTLCRLEVKQYFGPTLEPKILSSFSLLSERLFEGGAQAYRHRMKASPARGARLRFTTKDVGRGFYRGNRTGSMGAHTEYGRYMIDWRKTVHYNVPDITNFSVSLF